MSVSRGLRWLLIGVVGLILGPGLVGPPSEAAAQAQGPCGVVDAIDFPLDPSGGSVVYEYGLASSRYDGRLHAGEDWFFGRGSSYGQPVHAIARGRVTYAAPLGWGRDKGVVIIEHLMADGTWWYSMYGHMEEVDEYTFPTVYTCVEEGDIIGAIGRPRPAPHLHLEIRNFGPDSPGPGYWGTDPTLSGWRNPSKFIFNWQTWLTPFHLWHADIADNSGPYFPTIIRDDSTTIVFDDNRLKALTPEGLVLWRYVLGEERTILGVAPYDGAILVVDDEGLAQRWDLQGGFLEQWNLPGPLDAEPLVWGNLLVTHTPDNELIAYATDHSEVWRVADVLRPVDMQATRDVLGVMSIRGGLTLVGLDGREIDRATLRGTGDLTPASDGGFIVRSSSALWHVTPVGGWHYLADTPSFQRSTTALTGLPDGGFVFYAGSFSRTLYAYAADGTLRWSTDLTDLTGQPFVSAEDGALLVASGSGQVRVIGAASGAVCRKLDAWGNRAASAWAARGPDGVLRLHIADQVLGLDWDALSAGCG